MQYVWRGEEDHVIDFKYCGIVGMTLFTQVARLEQTVQLLRAVFVMIVWRGSTGQQVAAGAALMLTRAVTRRQMSGLH